ncbi:MAG: SlyX family protein [Gammaproteobacteria bacterium]|nr:SlyX protein [Rhodocyclaceae bacterium]MBU3908767.1 SlyX family protein [Gammaproteobacteria bacterium]MBU3990170.1 SlyX family protein [Gammaproteobacteria bacterium]MBU4004795.1 SlyX family protein [Gammaproteobacteria bacterium]MBU4021398.1 SlyX family protein [Gammaproteobacteria bacterium]
MEDRITELEVKLAFAEDLLETLNLTVYRQQAQIDQLQQELRALRQQLLQAQPAEQRNLLDEIPPHY